MSLGGWWKIASLTLRGSARERQRKLQRVVDGFVFAALGVTLSVIACTTALRQRGTAADLLRGATWKTSSTYVVYLAPAMFFHTDYESSPSITYTFPQLTALSSLLIRNTDDYRDRAAPLAVELSHDGHTFTEVARIDREFSTFEPRFASQTARYLRLRALKPTWLHLKHVEAYR
jgi:hypothetical protein